MALDKNYSTINRLKKVFAPAEETGFSSRIITKIQSNEYTAGITVGDVIHYDTVANEYIKSRANSPQNSEVFGIVESVNSDLSLNVVTNGSITIPSSKLINVSGSSNGGGNDIYFLSGTSAGLLQNCGPTFSSMIIKPIYQIAPHGQFTGIVRNYLGYLKPLLFSDRIIPIEDFIPLSFSDNVTKILLYSIQSDEFSICSTTFSNISNKFTISQIKRFSIRSIIISTGLDFIDFGVGVNYDSKISNDGKNILLFAKSINKIYHLVYDDSADTITLKYIIQLDLSGSPEDKLWAVDNELTCITVSTRSLTRPPSIFDTKITSHDVSSRIQYFRRNVNAAGSAIQIKWKKVHENHAFGYCDATPVETSGACVDSLSVTSGVYRTNDIKCKGKNFCLSTICLIQDQINYKSKITGFFSPRYDSIDKLAQNEVPIFIAGITNDTVIQATPELMKTHFFGHDLVHLQQASLRDTPTTRSYKCGFGFKNYRILNKENNFYYEDFSYRDSSGIEYFDAAENGGSFSLLTSYVRKHANPYFTYNIFDTPTTSIEASITKVSCTENNIFCCFRYGSEIGVLKFPFNSSDGFSPFRYFEGSNSGTVPSTSGFGLIFQNPSSSILNFNFFATDSIFFICTSNKTFINGTIELDTQNFDKAIFYTTNTNIFFKVDNKIFVFNNTNQNFDETTIGI